jgi:uncharacterized membrane protein YGL010W
MRSLTDTLAAYAGYHRDRRNVATHCIGIPLIVLALAALLSRPSVSVAGLPLSLALAGGVAGVGYYLALDLRFGAAMAALTALALWAGQALAAQGTAAWLAWAVGLFVVGWAFQFVGHWFEGRKPAFVDDVISLIVGPLFVVAELTFALGLRPGLRRAIEERAPRRGASAAAKG